MGETVKHLYQGTFKVFVPFFSPNINVLLSKIMGKQKKCGSQEFTMASEEPRF